MMPEELKDLAEEGNQREPGVMFLGRGRRKE
jgi:hypothetical protein